jgi:hypothetical protein
MSRSVISASSERLQHVNRHRESHRTEAVRRDAQRECRECRATGDRNGSGGGLLFDGRVDTSRAQSANSMPTANSKVKVLVILGISLTRASHFMNA